MLLLVAGVSACDLPTGVPRWETTWITPAEETTVSVAELLPAELAVNDDRTAFVFTLAPVNESWSLAEMCAACPPVTAVAPKPAFNTTVSTTVPLAASVQSVDVESGSLDLALTNGFDFDPLRPGVASDSGSMTVTLSSGTTTVASLVLDGRAESFAPGTTKDLQLTFAPSTIAEDLAIELTIDSPEGDVTTLNPNDALALSLSSDTILVSQATISVAGQTIEGVEAELDLAGVDLERVKDGTIFLDIENPFGVTGDLTVAIDPADGGAAIVKSVALPADTGSAQVHFDEAEITRLVGQVSTLSVTGTIDPGTITVMPAMEITIGMRLRVTVELGGNDDDNGN